MSQFTSEDIRVLEERDILRAPSTATGGKRTVNAAFLSPGSFNQGSVSSNSSSASPSVTISFRNFSNSAPKYISLPLEEESTDALEWIGFTPNAANEILSHFASRPNPDNCPDSLLDYVYGYIQGKDQKEDMEPVAAMTEMGLKTDFQDALTDPRFETIRGTGTLHYWIKDTLRINYRTMIMYQGRLKKAAERYKAGS